MAFTIISTKIRTFEYSGRIDVDFVLEIFPEIRSPNVRMFFSFESFDWAVASRLGAADGNAASAEIEAGLR